MLLRMACVSLSSAFASGVLAIPTVAMNVGVLVSGHEADRSPLSGVKVREW